MDSSRRTCYLSFPEDARTAAVAGELRADLEKLGITVLPPVAEEATGSTFGNAFYWLRQADAVVLDMSSESTWVAYDAGAAQALKKLVIPVAQPTDFHSPIQWELPRILEYEVGQVS